MGTFAGRNKPPSEGMDSQDLEAVKGSAIVRVWRREVRFESISIGAYSDMDAESERGFGKGHYCESKKPNEGMLMPLPA